MSDTTKEMFQEEVDKNYNAFVALDDDFYRHNLGRYALMKNAEIVEVFSSWQDARKAAKLLYKEAPFSIQKVEKEDVDLGFYSHAIL